MCVDLLIGIYYHYHHYYYYHCHCHQLSSLMFLLSTNRPYCVLFAGWSRKCKPKANNGFASKIERTCKIVFHQR